MRLHSSTTASKFAIDQDPGKTEDLFMGCRVNFRTETSAGAAVAGLFCSQFVNATRNNIVLHVHIYLYSSPFLVGLVDFVRES